MRILFYTTLALTCVVTTFAQSGPQTSSDYAARIEAYLLSHGSSLEAATDAGALLSLGRGGEPFTVELWPDSIGFAPPTEQTIPPLVEAEQSVALAKAEAVVAEKLAVQDAKPFEQKVLENEYFDIADEIAALAGKPALETTGRKSWNATKKSIEEVKLSKKAPSERGTGLEGGSGEVTEPPPVEAGSADDLLVINELQSSLLMVEAALRSYDPQWLILAQRHVLTGKDNKPDPLNPEVKQ